MTNAIINLGNYGNGHHAKNVSGGGGVMPTVTTGNHGLGQAIAEEGKEPNMAKRLRIRKLTPSEAIRLMGFERKDYEEMAKMLPDGAIYHCAGDSIVTTCLVGIFGQLLGVDAKAAIERHADALNAECKDE